MADTKKSTGKTKRVAKPRKIAWSARLAGLARQVSTRLGLTKLTGFTKLTGLTKLAGFTKLAGLAKLTGLTKLAGLARIRSASKPARPAKVERIERKELKQDKIQERMLDVLRYLNVHRAWVYGGLGVLILIGSSTTVGLWLLGQKRLEAAQAYDEIKANLELDITKYEEKKEKTAGKSETDPQRQALENFLEGYGNYVQSPIAWLRLAQLAWDQDDLDQAQKAFQQAASHPKVLPLQKAISWIGLAKIAERQDREDDVAKYYEKLKTNDYPLLAAWHSGHLNLRQGKKREARHQFEILLRQHSRTELEDLASDLIRSIP